MPGLWATREGTEKQGGEAGSGIAATLRVLGTTDLLVEDSKNTVKPVISPKVRAL